MWWRTTFFVAPASPVIPAEAGIQSRKLGPAPLDPRLRKDDRIGGHGVHCHDTNGLTPPPLAVTGGNPRGNASARSSPDTE